ncbi:MAG: HK97 family phage prohead protease [Methylocystis sp.]|nr:MAG: HK97 family phage prohead protease [Methylocystis sp.]
MIGRETKRAEAPLSLARPAGVVEGYASLFGVADTGGDIVMPGAFARSLAMRGAGGVKMLWQHRASEPIGVWTSIMEDPRDLKVSGRLDLAVARAREALSLLRGGAVDGLSIGFRTKRASMEKASGLRRLHEVDLWEISIVTFPMLTQARIDAIKRRPSPAAIGYAQARTRAQNAARALERQLQRL